MAILLIFAHPLEAKPTIEKLKAQAKGEQLFEFSGGQIVVSGMGCEAAKKATLRYGQSATSIWNLGLCGSQRPDLEVGSVHAIAQVGHRSLGSPVSLLDDGLSLLTSDTPVWGEQLPCDLVDMEGYAIAQAAQTLGIPCYLRKIVSDHCQPGGSALLRERLPTLADLLSKISITSI